MSFHRYSQPSYPGFPSLAAPPGGVSFNGTLYDFINVITDGDGSSGSAFADTYKSSGPNTGSYFHAFGEDATSSNFNRGMRALAENCDFLDDLLNQPLSVPVRTSLTTAGAPVSSIVLPTATFVGDSGSYPIEMLFNVVDDQDRAIVTSGTRVQVSSITGATIGDGFSSGAVTLNLNVSIPTSTQYRVFYGTRSKLATLPTDAFTFDRTYGLYADIIPYAGSGNWADGNPLSATNVEQALDEIVSDLGDTTNGASGARRIGYNGTGSLWAGGGALAALSVEQAIDEIVATLGTTTDGSSGSSKVGYNGASSAWKDATTLAATSVEAAIDEVVTTLASVASGTGQGVSKIGLYATNFAGALTGVGGGGILTTDTGLSAALSTINTRLVQRRAFTGVITDGSTSVGGDINGTTPFSTIATLGGGTFFLRRGSYSLNVAPGAYNYILTGEYGGKSVNLTNDTGALAAFTQADTININSFENIAFHGLASSATDYFQFNDGSVRFKHCHASAGSLDFYPSSFGLRLNIDSLMVFDDLDTIHRDDALLLHSLAGGQEITGVVRAMRINTVPAWNNASQAKYGLHIVDVVSSTTAFIYEALIFEECLFNITAGFDTGGGAVMRIATSNQPMTYKGCMFRQGVATSAANVLEIQDSSNKTFEDCVFYQSGLGKTLNIKGDSSNIEFRNCKFFTSSLTTLAEEFQVINGGGNNGRAIRFTNCYLEIRRGNTVQQERIVFNRDGGVASSTGGAIQLDNFHIKLSYSNTSSVYGHFMVMNTSTGVTNSGAHSVKDMLIDMNAKRMVEDGDSVFFFSGISGPFISISNLVLTGVREPLAPATSGQSDIVYLGNASLRGGSVNGDSTPGGLAWKSVFGLHRNSTVDNVVFYPNDNVVRGRCTSIQGTGCSVINCKVYITDLHTLEASSGWFCNVDNDLRNAAIKDNSFIMTGTSFGTMDTSDKARSLIHVGTNSIATGNHQVMGNRFHLSAAISGIWFEGSFGDMSHNTYQSSGGSTYDAMTIEGDYNIFYGNTTYSSDFGVNANLNSASATNAKTAADNISGI